MFGFNPTVQRGRFALDFIGTNKIILDVGCATGDFAKQFKEAGNKVYGVDIDQEYLKEAKDNCDKIYKYDVRKGLKFISGKVDMIFAGEFIELVSKAGFKVKALKGLGIMEHLIGSKWPLFCYGDIGIVAINC